MPVFVPGLQLCRMFYLDAVRPLLDEMWPGLRYAAARLGPGSEVLGFDTARSTDHDWGPRLELFLSPTDVRRFGADVVDVLSRRLPKRVLGWPTHFEPPGARVRIMADTDRPVAHRVVVSDVASWSVGQVGFDARAQPSLTDWLSMPWQLLAEATGGAVFHDGTGELSALRARLDWYPDDVWRFVLACQWQRIGHEEAFVGRAAQTGDELGSQVVAGRLAREVMRLCLLLARRWPPYTKWLGRAFATLPQAAGVGAALRAAVAADDMRVRQTALCDAYELVGEWQNALALAAPVPATRRQYHDRPFPVIDAQRYTAALVDAAGDRMAGLPLLGTADQFIDSTDVLTRPAVSRTLVTAAYNFS